MEQFKSRLGQIDLALKEARFSQAQVLFFELARHKCPREHLLELCQIARRLNQPYHILRWLYPIVRSETENSPPATDAEKSIFAVGLTRIGAFHEAQQLLQELPDQQADKFFALGLLYIWQWKYDQAIRPLKKYLHFFQVGHYSYLIGLLNLTAAYVNTDQRRIGSESAQKLLSFCGQNQFPLIKANTLEILAQSCLHEKNFSKAEFYLNESASILKSSGSDYELFVNKWKLILKILQESVDLEELTQLKVFAQKKRIFEAVRELDFYHALATRDENAFLKVYSGTRFTGYKKRIKSLFGFQKSVPRHFQCHFGDGNSSKKFNPDHLNLTKTSRLLFKIILSDYYRPIQLGEVFKELYPEEHFNPQTSLPRLYQVFRRLKKELKQEQAPLKVHWDKKQISWMVLSSFVLEVEPVQKKVELLKVSTHVFSVAQIIDELGVSKSAAYRLIDQALILKKIRRQGAGIFKKVG